MAINIIVDINIPIHTSNFFKILNNKNKGILANTQNLMVDGKNVFESERCKNDSKGIDEYCM